LGFGISKKTVLPYALCSMRILGVVMRFALRALPILLILALLPGVACAQGLIQGISGALEFDYSFFSTKTKDAAGVTTKVVANNYNPRFTLNIDTKIFPNLRLHAGGIVEGNITDSKTGGTDIKATVLKLRPYIDLTLETPLYTAAIGYYRMQDRTKVQRSPSLTLVNDQYYANLGWRPEGLPSIDMRFMRRNIYDEDKDLRDIQEDNITLVSRYFYKGLQAYYQGNYLHTKDDLNNLDVKQQLHSGRVTYADSFLNGRVSFNTTYDIFYNEVKTFSQGEGFVTTQIFPFAGLSIIANPVGDPDPITLLANPALINGNTTENAGIDLVADAPWVKRQMGLDFLNPTDVNQLLVWVDRELTSTIASSFSWEIWTSSDNIDWRRLTTIPSAPFGPFQNSFQLDFSSVRTRYIKVVTTPLNRGTPLVPPNIFVTELQALLRQKASDVAGKTERFSQTYSLDGKVRILDTPLLFYNLYYFYNRVDFSSGQRLNQSQDRYNLSNGFSANHRFSRVFSATASVAREDGEDQDKKRVSYIYSASIIADPLRTLHSSLVFSGRDEEIDKKPNNNNSIFLYNTAQLYQGIDLNLNGGVNFTKQETGEKGRDILINVGLNVVPHRTLTLGLNYWETMSRLSGRERGTSSTNSRRVDLNVNFNPFRTLYLSALIEFNFETGQRTEINQNYSINWSPFPDGALQFNISYNENLRSEDRLRERIFIPSVRYKLSNRSYLDLAYQMIRSDSQIQKTESQVVSSSLKIFF